MRYTNTIFFLFRLALRHEQYMMNWSHSQKFLSIALLRVEVNFLASKLVAPHSRCGTKTLIHVNRFQRMWKSSCMILEVSLVYFYVGYNFDHIITDVIIKKYFFMFFLWIQTKMFFMAWALRLKILTLPTHIESHTGNKQYLTMLEYIYT